MCAPGKAYAVDRRCSLGNQTETESGAEEETEMFVWMTHCTMCTANRVQGYNDSGRT